MVEEDAIAGENAIALAVVHRLVMGIDLGAGIRVRCSKRVFLTLGRFGGPEHFARAGLAKALCLGRILGRSADGFQQAQHAGSRSVGRVFGLVKADADMALRDEIINFFRLRQVDQAS
jgi:hypothetical protein